MKNQGESKKREQGEWLDWVTKMGLDIPSAVWLESAINDLEEKLNDFTFFNELENAGEQLLHVISSIHQQTKITVPLAWVSVFFERHKAELKTMPLRPRAGSTLYEGLRNYVDFKLIPGEITSAKPARIWRPIVNELTQSRTRNHELSNELQIVEAKLEPFKPNGKKRPRKGLNLQQQQFKDLIDQGVINLKKHSAKEIKGICSDKNLQIEQTTVYKYIKQFKVTKSPYK